MALFDSFLYKKINRQLLKIKRQLRQNTGYPYDPNQLSDELQHLTEGRFTNQSKSEKVQPYAYERDLIEGRFSNQSEPEEVPTVTSESDFYYPRGYRPRTFDEQIKSIRETFSMAREPKKVKVNWFLKPLYLLFAKERVEPEGNCQLQFYLYCHNRR